MNQSDILRLTVHGLNIYAYILGLYYNKGILLELDGTECKPAKNPFNGDKKTLLITDCFVPRNDGSTVEMFCYLDVELEDFKGNPFDFAALHYKLEGEALMEKLNVDMNLHLGSTKNAYEVFISKAPLPLLEAALPRISFFYSPISNTVPYATMNLLDAYKLIKGNRYKARTRRLRAITEPQEASQFKRSSFEYVTFAGVFSKRSDKALVHPSGLMVFDFDKVSDLPLLSKSLLEDPLFVTELMFISPSGNGLKWIISVDLKQCTHAEWFAAVANYLDTIFNMKVDRSGKDLSRACFLCHDPEVYIHPDYLDMNFKDTNSTN